MLKQVNLSKFNNTQYQIGASKLKNICWYLCNVLFFKSACPHYSIKILLLKLFGAKMGKNILIKPHVNIKYPWKLILGNDIWIGEQAWIDNLDMVTIGNNVCISQGAIILCGNHNYKIETFDLITQPISIENGVWIGAKSMVCGGAICKENSVLMVQSVAVGILENNGIYRGNPAIKIKERYIE